MRIQYDSCPYCYSKKVKEIKKHNSTIVKCEECGNQIDRFPDEQQDK